MNRKQEEIATNVKEDAKAKTLRDLELHLKTRFITDVRELAERTAIPECVTPSVESATKALPVLFPESLLNRVQKGNRNDPVLLQFFPSERELDKKPGFSCDPLDEFKLIKSEKNSLTSSCVMQKYKGRALIITTNSCACQCRFCFRRFFPKNRALFPIPAETTNLGSRLIQSERSRDYLEEALKAIRDNHAISEVILSGGDPLVLSNHRLRTLFHCIGSINHVKRVRIHSRVPILTPKRIDSSFPSFDEFQKERKSTPLILHIALHVNSPNEINTDVAEAILVLRRKGYVLTSQSVLLKGINDDAIILASLYEKLVDLGVIPYYLHQLDRVQGAAHFETPTAIGRTIIESLGALVPGYAVPHYVREIPNRPMKTNLFINRDVD